MARPKTKFRVRSMSFAMGRHLGPNLGIAMTDQDIVATFLKRRLPTKVPRPPEFNEGASNFGASNKSYVFSDGVLRRPKKGDEHTTPELGLSGEPCCCKCHMTRAQLGAKLLSCGACDHHMCVEHSDPTGSPPKSLCRCCARTTCCTCGEEVIKIPENRCAQPCPHYTCKCHQKWNMAMNGLPISGCKHCMAPSPLVSANSTMVAPTQRYPSDEGSPPKFMANANKGI
eukprot:4431687-Amphidinium_carterae.1